MTAKHQFPAPTRLYDEVLAANASYVSSFGQKGRPCASASARIRNFDMHGRAA